MAPAARAERGDMHDLVIKGGTLVDGTGDAARRADVVVDGPTITEVCPPGRLEAGASEVIDATGKIVTPGFVDVHTHYDGQVTWDPLLTPSCWHGVTTVVMGNCGVGFAPAEPDRHDWLIGLMEGVEDIPGTALSAGIRWGWETFPEFLDFIESVPKTLDVGAQVPHGAVRSYVMGERGARNEPATAEDIEAMAAIVQEGVEAGAMGFSTSRTIAHRAIDGEPVPGTFAAEDEMLGLAEALARAGTGVFELAPAGIMGEDLAAPDREMGWMIRVAAKTGVPVTFGLTQHDIAPGDWARLLELTEKARAEGAPLRPQVASRPLGLLIGLQTFHPLAGRKAYQRIAQLPLDERVQQMRDPRVRRSILDETAAESDDRMAFIGLGLDRMFQLGDPPQYEPRAEDSVMARAERAGTDPWELFYDLLLEKDGRELLVRPLLGYSDFTQEPIREMLTNPASVLGLGDGGAHVGAICDASNTTYMLTHWVRDRTRGPRIPLEQAVRKMTSDTASLFGMHDRGTVTTGKKADLNVIDLDGLRLRAPRMIFDLPGGARRLVQSAEGYAATIVSGQVVVRDGAETGARPGQLVRSG